MGWLRGPASGRWLVASRGADYAEVRRVVQMADPRGEFSRVLLARDGPPVDYPPWPGPKDANPLPPQDATGSERGAGAPVAGIVATAASPPAAAHPAPPAVRFAAWVTSCEPGGGCNVWVRVGSSDTEQGAAAITGGYELGPWWQRRAVLPVGIKPEG